MSIAASGSHDCSCLGVLIVSYFGHTLSRACKSLGFFIQIRTWVTETHLQNSTQQIYLKISVQHTSNLLPLSLPVRYQLVKSACQAQDHQPITTPTSSENPINLELPYSKLSTPSPPSSAFPAEYHFKLSAHRKRENRAHAVQDCLRWASDHLPTYRRTYICLRIRSRIADTAKRISAGASWIYDVIDLTSCWAIRVRISQVLLEEDCNYGICDNGRQAKA